MRFMKHIIKILVITSMLTAFSSCHVEEDSVGPDAQTSASNAAYLAILSGVSQINQTTTNTVFNPSQSQFTVYPINSTQDCASGGSTTTSGALTVSVSGNNPELFHISYSYSVSLNQCSTSSIDGDNFTVTGNDIAVTGTSDWTVSGTFGYQSYSSSDSASVSGNLDVSGDASMNCDVSLSEVLTQSGNGSSGNENGSLAGTLCGEQINNPISVTVTVSST
jgi:hypothetical protein